MIHRLTVDLYYEGEAVPACRMHFFGDSREMCLDQLGDQAERDPALRALCTGREEYKGLRLRETWKLVPLDKVQRSEIADGRTA